MVVAEKTVFRIAAEYAARLGVSCPEIVTQNSRIKPFDYRQRGNSVGLYTGKSIVIDRRRSIVSVRHTVAHEFIHRAFPRLAHGDSFDDRINALMSGEMFFRGAVRRPDKILENQDGTLAYKFGRTIYYDGTSCKKVVVLDTKAPDRPLDRIERTSQLEERIKAFDTKIKRLTTLRKKVVRKLQRIQKEENKA